MPRTVSPPSAYPDPGATGAPAGPLSQSYDRIVRGPVLLATDGSSSTDATLLAARQAAERLGTTVEVVGVLEPFPSYVMAPEVPILPPDVEEARRTGLGAAIARRLMSVGNGAEDWPIQIHYGSPASTIVATARGRDSSVIVVGSGRHEARDRIFGGERAVRVVRSADRPVLVVRPDFMSLPSTVVVGVDFSPASVRAARAALMLLPAQGRLVLTYVQPVVDLPTVPPATVAVDTGFDVLVSRWHEAEELRTIRLFERLRAELAPYVSPTVTVETRTRRGVVLRELLAVADEVGAGMLAVGTHGPNVIERLFIGSVAADALRDSGMTVLVSPAPSPVECARLDLRLHGTTELRKADDWEPALAAFTQRNAGRRARLEVDDPEFGAQTQEFGYTLRGISYDHHDRRVEIMMSDPNDRVNHLTRTIARVDDVGFYATADGRERALRIGSGRGQTVLTFVD
ncbi:MAG TPA: universal stress protein [Gemmatimonadaceae bacterium]|nr:universal stress protein [Gemmatimonadaceae bacterium]